MKERFFSFIYFSFNFFHLNLWTSKNWNSSGFCIYFILLSFGSDFQNMHIQFVHWTSIELVHLSYMEILFGFLTIKSGEAKKNWMKKVFGCIHLNNGIQNSAHKEINFYYTRYTFHYAPHHMLSHWSSHFMFYLNLQFRMVFDIKKKLYKGIQFDRNWATLKRKPVSLCPRPEKEREKETNL